MNMGFYTSNLAFIIIDILIFLGFYLGLQMNWVLAFFLSPVVTYGLFYLLALGHDMTRTFRV